MVPNREERSRCVTRILRLIATGIKCFQREICVRITDLGPFSEGTVRGPGVLALAWRGPGIQDVVTPYWTAQHLVSMAQRAASRDADAAYPPPPPRARRLTRSARFRFSPIKSAHGARGPGPSAGCRRGRVPR